MPSTQSLGARREEKEFIFFTMGQPRCTSERATFSGESKTLVAVGDVDRRGTISVGTKSLIASISTTSKPCYSACFRRIFESSTGKGQNSLMPKSTPCRRTKTKALSRLNDRIYSDGSTQRHDSPFPSGLNRHGSIRSCRLSQLISFYIFLIVGRQESAFPSAAIHASIRRAYIPPSKYRGGRDRMAPLKPRFGGHFPTTQFLSLA